MSNLQKIITYLEKRAVYGPLISSQPDKALDMILVIPAYREEDLLLTLSSLIQADSNGLIIEIIILLNYSEKDTTIEKPFHELQYQKINQWISNVNFPNLTLHCPSPIPLNTKHAGVGLARKIGMDEATRRFLSIKKEKGIIINLDADCLTTHNYWRSIYTYFNSFKSKPCVSIGFEHRIHLVNKENRKAIIDYELHLRYYIQAQKFILYPFAFQTLGSCFAIETESYCEQGGMNQRQAGEDFYFIHKYSLINQLGEIAETLVFPSSRTSDRVPFGTGKAVSHYLMNGNQSTYSLESILLFGSLLKQVKTFFTLEDTEIKNFLASIHTSLMNFFIGDKIIEEVNLCRKNSSSLNAFEKRFMRWLNPFRLMKYLHYMRENGFPDSNVLKESIRLLEQYTITIPKDLNSEIILDIYRTKFSKEV